MNGAGYSLFRCLHMSHEPCKRLFFEPGAGGSVLSSLGMVVQFRGVGLRHRHNGLPVLTHTRTASAELRFVTVPDDVNTLLG